MPDQDDPTAPAPAPAAPGSDEAHAELQAALAQVAQLFGQGGGDGQHHGLLDQLGAFGRLSDPAVRGQLTAALQNLQAAGIAEAGQGGAGQGGSPMVLDLRGTEAGQALREMALKVAQGGGGAFTAISPAQIITSSVVTTTDQNGVTQTTTSGPTISSEGAAEPVQNAAIVDAAEPTRAQAHTQGASQMQEMRRVANQPSLVEDAESTGLFGWLTRMLNGRR